MQNRYHQEIVGESGAARRDGHRAFPLNLDRTRESVRGLSVTLPSPLPGRLTREDGSKMDNDRAHSL